jgi:K+ transporter
MYDHDHHFIELLLDNEKSKIILYGSSITIYLLIESFLKLNITKFTEGGYVTLIIALCLITWCPFGIQKINKATQNCEV